MEAISSIKDTAEAREIPPSEAAANASSGHSASPEQPRWTGPKAATDPQRGVIPGRRFGVRAALVRAIYQD